MSTTFEQEPLTARAQLHHKVRRAFGSSIATYFRKNPELLTAPGSDDTVVALLALMEEVLIKIDGYEIQTAADKPGG